MATCDVVRVKLWCVPRSTSTAILKCLTYVPNIQVWFEPYLSGYFHSKFGKYRNAMADYISSKWKIDVNDIDKNTYLEGISGKFVFSNNCF